MSEVASHVGVRNVPETVHSLTTLGAPDYADLFTIATPLATTHSAEDWARAVLEQSPLARQHARRLWRSMGLRLGPRGSPDHVQGWRIAAHGDSWIRIETGSWYLTAQALCLVEEGQVSLSLSLRHDRRIAALVWAPVAGPHQRAVPAMLRQAVELIADERG